jgi:hypothetical protein
MVQLSGGSCAVIAALEDLRITLGNYAPRDRRGWDGDPFAIEREWPALERALRDAAEVLNDPQVGQGLESVWLRLVLDAASSVEVAVRQWDYGWRDIVQHGNPDLLWLANNGVDAGKKLATGAFEGSGGISQILKRDQSPIARLRTLATDWIERFKSAPREPTQFERMEIWDRWMPWERRRDEYIRSAGVLILQAVNALEVKTELLLDRKFLHQVVDSLGVPGYLPRERMQGLTADQLNSLIDELAASPALEHIDESTGQRPQPHSTRATDEEIPANFPWPLVAESPSGKLKLFGPQNPVVVCGVEYKKLTAARYNVLLTLCQAGTSGLKKRDLIHRSKHSSAVDILRFLAKQDQRWASVIVMGGVSGGRYRLA